MGWQHDSGTQRDSREVSRRIPQLETTRRALHQELEGTGKTYGDVGQLIYHYRQCGYSMYKISRLMHEDHGIDIDIYTVSALYRQYLTVLSAEVGIEEQEQLRFLEVERLNAMQAAIWNQAENGDVKAVDAVLRVMAQRHKLTRLDQPSVSDPNAQMNVLIVGDDKEAFLDALRVGRVAGTDRDDEGSGSSEE